MRSPVRAHLCGIQTAWTEEFDTASAVAEVSAAILRADLAQLIVFFSPEYDVDVLAAELGRHFPGVPTVGCSTSGGICPAGAIERGLVAIAFPASGFRIAATCLRAISHFDVEGAAAAIRGLRRGLDQRCADLRPGHRFALTLIDGLANVEETVVSTIAWALDGIPLVGGSSGDDLRFRDTILIFDGSVLRDAAAILLIETDFPTQLFKSDNFDPTDTKFVVTHSDDEKRIVHELNAEPAAREYAMAIGLDPEHLTPMSFAAHPLAVKVGGEYFCRSIRHMNPDGSLTFFCAIGEGVVMTLAEPRDIVAATRDELERLDEVLGGLDIVIGFDCVLRRLDAENRQVRRDISDLYRRFSVVGFETYGEQYRSMHLNQTFTGIAIGRAPGMSAVTDYPASAEEREAKLVRKIAKLERINAALMAHVERATDQHEGAYSLFQTAIMLEGRVRGRTTELTQLMHSLERSNEALKAAKEEAETANRSKTKFLAAASHDLLQPLNAARLSCSALVGMPLSDEANGIAGQVERALQTIEDVIKTLLDISKLDAGVVRPVKKAVRLRNVMAGLEQSFRPIAEGKSVRFIINCPDLAVESDEPLLQRVLQNLVSNAIRYTERGGVLVAARAREGRCVIEIIDTGLGIPDAERDLVFEEFYRGKQAGASDAGLGLGLSIVRRLVQALDHRLDYWSRVGHGSRFRVALPLARGIVEEPGAGVGDAFSLAGASVLVVENDAATKTALTRLLQSWRLHVTAISDIAEWRPWRNAPAPDLMIADYHLDNGAIGLDVIDEVRAATRADLPAIVITADHSEAVEALVIETSCELMHKPVKPAQLRSLLSFLLESTTRRN